MYIAVIQIYFNTKDCSINGVFFAMELLLVLRQPVSSLSLLPAEIAVPYKVSGEVDTLHVVLNTLQVV